MKNKPQVYKIFYYKWHQMINNICKIQVCKIQICKIQVCKIQIYKI